LVRCANKNLATLQECEIKMGSYSHDISFMTVRLAELKYNSSKPSTILSYVKIQASAQSILNDLLSLYIGNNHVLLKFLPGPS
jgi:hypothetical protein